MSKPRRIQRERTKGWCRRYTDGSSGEAFCLSCDRNIHRKPIDCSEPKHSTYYTKRAARSLARRRQRKVEARSSGRVYRHETLESRSTRGRQDYPRLRHGVLRRLGNKCAICGFDDYRAIQIDHKHGRDRSKPRLTGPRFLKELWDMPQAELLAQFQCLCANCNQIKRWQNNEFAEKHPARPSSEKKN